MKTRVPVHRLALFMFFLLVFGPLMALFFELGQSLLAGQSSELRLIIPTGRGFGLLIRSLSLSLGVATGAMILGIFGAVFLWRWRTGVMGYLRWLVLLLIAVPPYVHVFAWLSVVNAFNSPLSAAGLPEIQFQGGLEAGGFN